MPKKRKTRKKENIPLRFFALFIVIAVFTVILLEYIDFRKGKESFIFSKIIHLKTRTDQITAFNEKFINVLEESKIIFEHFKDKKGKYHFKFNVDHNGFDRVVSRVKKIVKRLAGELALSEIRRIDNKSLMLYSVKFEKEVSHILLITRLENVTAKKKERKKKPVAQKKRQEQEKRPVQGKKQEQEKRRTFDRTPRIAFVIDDIGEYEIGALELKRMGIPITASILPESRRAYEEARWVEEYGLHAMLHIPMQPRGSSGARYGSHKTITLESSDAEMRALIRKAKEVVPHAAGVNNHMGSLVTSNRDVMERFLKIVKEEGLFFFDSKTIASTTGYAIAKRLGIKTAIRDVFLDDGEKSYKNAVREIKRLVDKALQNGKAIAIGHPHRTTFRAIEDSIAFIKEKGIKIVYLSELLE